MVITNLDFIRKYAISIFMKTIQLIRPTTFYLLALTFISSAYSADKYFGNSSAIFISDNAWYSDEALTQPTTHPIGEEDTAIFYKTKGTATYAPTSWVTQVDTYVGNVISSGDSGIINLGKELLNQGVPINFQIYNTLSVQICDEASTMSFGTSFEDKEGTAAVELTIGNIDIGTQVYGGKTYDSYSTTSLSFSYGDSRLTSSLINVIGDVNFGGCGVTGANGAALLNLTVDKMAVMGIMNIKRNGWGYSNVTFNKAGVLELGGLVAENRDGDFTIANGSGGSFTSEIVFKNALGTDYQYIGAIVDDGNNRPDMSAIKATMNVTMDGEGTQRIYQAVQTKTDIQGRMGGTYTVKNGRLFMDNSRIAADYRLATLSLEGGKFGAGHYESSNTGTAYFKTANFESGGFAYENFAYHNTMETEVGDKIIITETFTKAAGSGKISVDFSDASGNALNLENFILADSADSVEYWAEILTAGELSGFNLDTLLSDGAYDANADFYAEGIENGVVVFKWVESLDSGYSLQVGFAQVPEPASAVALGGVLALVYVGMRSKRRR